MVPGGEITVSVFDPLSLTPISGALVIAHQDDAGTYNFVDSQVTGPDGSAELFAGAAGTETIITVDLAGYDLFTFHGVPRDVLHVPLAPSALQAATTEGRVTSPFPNANISNNTNQEPEQELEAGGTIPKRSWQSLKERFGKRNVKSLPREIATRLRLILNTFSPKQVLYRGLPRRRPQRRRNPRDPHSLSIKKRKRYFATS